MREMSAGRVTAEHLLYWADVAARAERAADVADTEYRQFRAKFTMSLLRKQTAKPPAEWKVRVMCEEKDEFVAAKSIVARARESASIARDIYEILRLKADL